MVVSAIWLLTVSEVCGPRIPVESTCPGTVGINAETGTEVDVVGTAVVGARSTPTTGTIMRGELLENKSVNVRQHHLATYLQKPSSRHTVITA